MFEWMAEHGVNMVVFFTMVHQKWKERLSICAVWYPLVIPCVFQLDPFGQRLCLLYFGHLDNMPCPMKHGFRKQTELPRWPVGSPSCVTTLEVCLNMFLTPWEKWEHWRPEKPSKTPTFSRQWTHHHFSGSVQINTWHPTRPFRALDVKAVEV